MNRLDLIVKLILEGGFLMILFSINNRVYFTCFLPCFVKQRENFHKFSNFSLKTFGFGL